jgi:hypothetical protein
MQELFDIEDAMVTTYHPTKYLKPGERLEVEEIEDRARSQREIVIGYLDHNLKASMITDKNEKIDFEQVSKLIVMTNAA